jgi:hypothetical protein
MQFVTESSWRTYLKNWRAFHRHRRKFSLLSSGAAGSRRLRPPVLLCDPDILLLQDLTREKRTVKLALPPILDVPKHFTAYYEELQGNAEPYIGALLVNNKSDRRPIRIRDDKNKCPGLIAGLTVTLNNKDIHLFRYIGGLVLPWIPF